MTAAITYPGTSALSFGWVRLLVALATISREDEETRATLSKQDAAVLADVEASLRGDGGAYARIIDRYQGTIAQRMQRFTRDASAVEELVHDVFVEAHFSLGKYRAEAPLEHWLQRIATRVGYRYWQRRDRMRVVSFDERVHDHGSQVDTAATVDATEQIGAILEQMPARDRLVLTLLYLEDHSVAEAADLAGWSQTMVKVQAYRARKKMRKLLEQKSG